MPHEYPTSSIALKKFFAAQTFFYFCLSLYWYWYWYFIKNSKKKQTNVHEYDKLTTKWQWQLQEEKTYKLKIDQLIKERVKTAKLHWGRRYLQWLLTSSWSVIFLGGSSKLR